jgi:hypothetical protein
MQNLSDTATKFRTVTIPVTVDSNRYFTHSVQVSLLINWLRIKFPISCRDRMETETYLTAFVFLLDKRNSCLNKRWKFCEGLSHISHQNLIPNVASAALCSQVQRPSFR